MRWSASGSRIAWLDIGIWFLLSGRRQQLDGGVLLQRRIEVAKHSQLTQDDRAGRVTVEQLDPPVPQPEDVAARRVHAVARRREGSLRKPKRPVVRPLQSQLDDNDVTVSTGYVHVVELAVHIGERRPVIFNRLSHLARPAVGHPDRFVDEYPVRVEARDPRRDVLDLGRGIRLADELFVCHVVPSLLGFTSLQRLKPRRGWTRPHWRKQSSRSARRS